MSAAELRAAQRVMAGAIADRIQQTICATIMAIYPDDHEAAEVAMVAEAQFIARGADAIAERVARALADAGRVPALPQPLPAGRGYLLSMLR